MQLGNFFAPLLGLVLQVVHRGAKLLQLGLLRSELVGLAGQLCGKVRVALAGVGEQRLVRFAGFVQLRKFLLDGRQLRLTRFVVLANGLPQSRGVGRVTGWS